MKILIDIGHPAHVHLLKNFALTMQNRGHKLLFTCRDKEFEVELLKSYGFDYIVFGKKFKSILGKIIGLIKFDIQEIVSGIKFKPDIFISAGSMYASHASFILRRPHLSFEDTFNMEQVRLYKPFTEAIFINKFKTPPLKGDNIVEYSGYHELAYLHPNWFTPNRDIYHILGINNNQPYVIIRFVSWNATHDVGQGGLTLEEKIKLVKKLATKAKIFISSEGELPNQLKGYQIKIPPEKMHDALNFASLFIGEGATMASESAMVGTPSIYINSLHPNTIKEQEQYGLIYYLLEIDKIIERSINILDSHKKDEFTKKRDVMLSQKIDVTAFFIWFVENYPKSKETIKENPNYQKRFK